MKYLETANGVVVNNEEGKPIQVKIGDRVVLRSNTGLALFAYEYAYQDKDNLSQLEFVIKDAIDRAFLLRGNHFDIIMAYDTGIKRPIISAVYGDEYGSKRTFIIENHCQIMVTPRSMAADRADHLIYKNDL